MASAVGKDIPTAWEEFRRTVGAHLRKKASTIRYDRRSALRVLRKVLPITEWLPNYKKKYFVGDIISGCTVGIMNIPQGMAYGVLAGTEAIHGLYASFFPVLIYSVFCTSQHASVGTFAVTSLMTSGIVNSIANNLYNIELKSNFSNSSGAPPPDPNVVHAQEAIPIDIRVGVMIAVTLAVGLWQVVMGIFRVGSLAVLLSDHLIRGFTCAAAFHVFTSQVKLVFGLYIPERYGPLKLVYYYIDFFSQIASTHVPTLIVSIICIAILYVVRTFVNQNPKVMKIIRIPFPIELLVIIFGTVASYYIDLDGKYGVKTVKDIPTGLPAPRVPPYEIIPEILGRSFSLAVVASAVLISLAKIFASKHRYSVDANQELIAIGASNIFGSFFLCIPTTGALARSAVQESVGGSTQLVSVVSAVIVLIVLVAVGRLLQPLPRACLGSIIMVALINMLKQVLDLGPLFKISLIDASIFLVTFLATLILDVDLGLAVGVLFSLLMLFFRLKCAPASQSLSDSGGSQKDDAAETPKVGRLTAGVLVHKIQGPLFFGNAEDFVNRVRTSMEEYKIPDISSTESPSRTARFLARFHASASAVTITALDIALKTEDGMTDIEEPEKKKLQAVIIDMSAVSFVDVVGANNLKTLVKDTKKEGIRLFLANCPDNVRLFLIRADILSLTSEDIFVRDEFETLSVLGKSDEH